MPRQTDRPDPASPTPADVAALREDFFVRLDVADDELLKVLTANKDLVALARQWRWSDTEVRDTASRIFEEALGIELE